MRMYQFDFMSNTSFSFIHLVNGVYHKIHILYDMNTDSYYMNVDKYKNNKFINIINSVKITMGINLFLQYSYLNLGAFFVIPTTDTCYTEDPKSTTIKNNYFIIWGHD